MTTFKRSRILVFFLCSILCFSCSKEDSIVKENIQFKDLDFNYNINDLDAQFDNDIVKLGRVLFYDKELSLNSTVSCGSCHKQEFSFSDNVAKSEGFLGGLTDRNTPNLINTKFNGSFFWDGRVSGISNAVTMPLFDHKEMGMTPETLINRISKLDYYDELFKDAYGHNKITGPRVTLALVEFVSSILSTDSEIDRFLGHRIRLDDAEMRGMFLFREHCNSCHDVLSTTEDDRGPNNPYLGVSSFSFNSKVDIGLIFQTAGPFPKDQFLRIPSLRNISSTAPYMHDGRFETLLEVIEHYDEEVEERNTVDERLLGEDGLPQKLKLKQKDKENLISFLETLSDPSVEKSEKYSNPFK